MKKKWLVILFALLCTANCFRQINKYEKVGDYNMSYVDAIKAEQKFVNYCEENNLNESKIFAGFNSIINLKEPKSGYRKSDKKYAALSDTLTADVKICVFSNIDPRADYDSLLNEINLEPLTSFEERKVWIDVYKFKGFVNDSTPHIAVTKREMKKL